MSGDDLHARVSVLENQQQEHEKRMADVEARATDGMEKAEGRVSGRVDKIERNLLWLVLLVVGAVISRILEKVGLGG